MAESTKIGDMEDLWDVAFVRAQERLQRDPTEEEVEAEFKELLAQRGDPEE